MEKNKKTLIEYISEFLDYCKKERDFSPKTIENYNRYLARFIKWLKGSNLDRLNPKDLSIDHINKYREYLSKQNIKKVTINYYLIALRVLLSYFVEKDIISLLSEKIKLQKIQRDRNKKLLAPEQLKKVLEAPDTSHNIGLRDKAVLEFLATTRLKVAEVTRINKDEITFDKNTKRAVIEIMDKKGFIRTIYISKNTVKWLKKYLKKRRDNDKALFINYRPGKKETVSRRLTPRSIERIVEKYRSQIKFPHSITPELLRNAYIKAVLNQKLPRIEEIFKHKYSTIKRYSPAPEIKASDKRKGKDKNLEWQEVEDCIEKEISWFRNNIETISPRYQTKDVLIACEDCLLRKIAILIVSGKMKAIKLKFKENFLWKEFPESKKDYRHGKEWHRKMMNLVSSYFKSNDYDIIIEPILNFGRADLGVFSKSLNSSVYIEIGTTSLYKLLYNLLTMKNSIFLIIPSEEYIIELRT